MSKTNITAHSGCLKTPMDSLDSILKAIVIGADFAEVDVNCDLENIAVLKHDAVTENDLNLVKLEDVFNISKKTGIKINLDMKNKNALDFIKNKAIELDIVDHLILSGVDENDTAKLKEQNYPIKYLMNVEIDDILEDDIEIEKYINFALNTNAYGLNIDFRFCTEKLIQKANQNNLAVSVWTVNTKENIDKFKNLNVWNITTNIPDVAIC